MSVITLLFRHLEADEGEIPLHQLVFQLHALSHSTPLKKEEYVDNWKT